jgi:hypothetical protein
VPHAAYRPTFVHSLVMALTQEIPAPLPAAPGVVLLVDDEDLVRTSTADMRSAVLRHMAAACNADDLTGDVRG